MTIGHYQDGENLISFMAAINSRSRVPTLDLELVRAFVAVAERGSFSAAASCLFRTQAAVSQQIQRLEAHLGEVLLVRTSRTVRLSQGGEHFLEYAKRLLRLSEDAVAAARGQSRTLIRIGAPDEIASYVLMPALAALREKQPNFAFEIATGATRELLPLLETRHDMVFGIALPGSRGGHTLASVPLRWAGDWNGTGAVPLALYPEGCVMRGQALAALDAAGLPWEIAVSASAVTAVESAARARLAVGPLAVGLSAPDLSNPRGLPPLPKVELRMFPGRSASTASELLASELRRQFRRNIAGRDVAHGS